MFISSTHRGYDRYGSQFAKGRFLVLCQPDEPDGAKAEIRAIVRSVTLRQLGHFMMGSARAGGHSLTLSGSYGNDGLPRDVPRNVYDKAIPVPAEMVAAWNTGGGWNGVGSEAEAMQAWALKTFPAKRSMY